MSLTEIVLAAMLAAYSARTERIDRAQAVALDDGAIDAECGEQMVLPLGANRDG